MKPKQLITELIILTSLYAFTFIGEYLLIKKTTEDPGLNIVLHDTYLSIPFNQILFTLIPFLLLTVIVYLIRAGIYRFKKQLVNILLIISNFTFIILMLPILKLVLDIERSMIAGASGWTIYPPLSALGRDQFPETFTEHPHYENYLIAVIGFFLLILIISSILTGKNWKTNTNEQAST